MKKLLALVLVLAVAQFASAAISWDVADNGNGTFAVSLVTDEQVNAVSLPQMVSTGGVFAVDSGAWSPAFTSTQPILDLSGFGVSGYGGATANITAAGTYTTGTLIAMTVTGEAGDVITIGDLAAFGMTAYVSTQAGGQQSLASVGADSFTLVPEPMTMALLGLGGLFIRRRRA
ncbi:MAG: PEP-CTERM sorting domain-containing protein [Sedimentisphaeraceae bacterium JB056]